MQTSEEQTAPKSSHRRVQASTSLSRRYVKRPTSKMQSMSPVQRNAEIRHFREQPGLIVEDTYTIPMGRQAVSPASMAEPVGRMSRKVPAQASRMTSRSMSSMSGSRMSERAMSSKASQISSKSMRVNISSPDRMAMQSSPAPHPMQVIANQKMQRRSINIQSQTSRVSEKSAQELKEQAIRKAMMAANKMDQKDKKANKKQAKKMSGVHFGFGRVILAMSCAAAAVMAIVYFVNLNMPDISLTVAAMQNGMELTYPSYIPRDYVISSVTSEEGKVIMVFENSSAKRTFSLSEEKSSWDSNALLTNYVKPEYGDNYSIVREQGLTIYINGSNASWVNGGNFYKISAQNGVLTNKQIKSIATSL